MDARSTAMLRRWLLCFSLLVIVIVAFNIVMDPYMLFGTPRWPNLNQRKPAIEDAEALIKAYDVLRGAPRTLVLGTSSAARGINSLSSHWPSDSRPVYNMSLVGRGPYTSYRYLQHVLATGHRVDQVVIFVDFEYFEKNQRGDPTARGGGEFEDRLAVTADGRPNGKRGWQRMEDFFRAGISFDALVNSVMTLAGNLASVSSNIEAGNAEYDVSEFRSMGDYPVLEISDISDMQTYMNGQLVDRAFTDLDNLLSLCQSHGIRVTLVINPVIADVLELIDRLGEWPAYEDWKRRVVKIADAHTDQSTHYSVPAWDFNGYETYSVDEFGPDKHYLSWFWDGTHYTWDVGDQILDRIFGEGTSSGFGVQVTTSSIESRLLSVRNAQAQYRQAHPDDALRVQNLIKWKGL